MTFPAGRQAPARPHLGVARLAFSQHVLAAAMTAIEPHASAPLAAAGDVSDALWGEYARLCGGVASCERRALRLLFPGRLAMTHLAALPPVLQQSVAGAAAAELRLAARKRTAFKRSMRRLGQARAARVQRACSDAEPTAVTEEMGSEPSWHFYGPVRPLNAFRFRTLVENAAASIGVEDQIGPEAAEPCAADDAAALVDELRTCMCVPAAERHGVLCPFGGE